MSRKVHIIVQSLLVVVQVCNLALPLFSGNVKGYVLVGVGVVQGVIGILNQAFNTDGTPQSVAFKDTNAAALDKLASAEIPRV